MAHSEPPASSTAASQADHEPTGKAATAAAPADAASAGPAASTLAPPDAACHNCGAPRTGPYCAQCGQAHGPLVRSLREFLREWAEDVAALDSRVLRTLIPLLFRPGRLTIDYDQGRRIRYVTPLRLYMIASVAFFFALALSPGVVNIQDDPPAASSTAEATNPDVANPGATRGDAPPASSSVVTFYEATPPTTETGFEAWVDQQARRAQGDPRGFERFWVRVMGWSMFVFLPIAALLLAVTYRRQRRYYVQHLVFTLHTHSFVFLVLAAAMGIGRLLVDGPADSPPWPVLVALGVATVYTYVALLRVYGEGIVRTIVKFCVLGLVYIIAQSMIMAASSLIALGLF